MDNKKSGIRLRHLQQQPDDAIKRDLSPNNPNRKKIFDKNQRIKLNERAPTDERQKKRVKNEQQSFNQYQQLIDNLKKKTMEVQLHDETIKYLNKQIEQLKNSLKLKDRQIARLTHQISILQKEQLNNQNMPKESVFDSFKNPNQTTPSYTYQPNRFNNQQSAQIINQKPKAAYPERSLIQQISLGNLKTYHHDKHQQKQAQILSPFMALNNTSSLSNLSLRQQRKEVKTSRISNNPVPSHHTSTQYSGFQKKKPNNQFDFSREQQYIPKKSMIDSVNKQLQKFNIFGEPLQSKKEILAKSKLEIEDSGMFKFEDVHNDW